MHFLSRAITWTHQQAPAAPWHKVLFTALLLRRKYLLWRCALACESHLANQPHLTVVVLPSYALSFS